MGAELNHTIIWCRDKERSSAFLTDVLDLPAPQPFHQFLVVKLDNGVSLDFMEKSGEVSMQHYAFLIAESAFDAALARVVATGKRHWADPGRTKPDETYSQNGGRGFYFEDPDGHLLEIMTRPYVDD